jgi:hypothetical protein
MMRSLKKSTQWTALGIVAGSVLSVGLYIPNIASTDATACTLFTDSKPFGKGTCARSFGTNCYLCDEYDSDQGFRTCAMYPDGSGAKCGAFQKSPTP